ncbi:hypothetical protein PR048_023790 [Dryococelus australis]|uniref:Uncharacterized protein n=1 Tax=Dryococelus australis TaxID=614101 RepID=A0ABQ9GV55_9NEOP|nr:hypothetical protein PR048_023790 [Dryococelus australis]
MANVLFVLLSLPVNVGQGFGTRSHRQIVQHRQRQVMRADEGEARLAWSSSKMKGGGEQEFPGKTRRSAASSSTIPTSENPGAVPRGIEPGSPKWKASSLTAPPPRPPHSADWITNKYQFSYRRGAVVRRVKKCYTSFLLFPFPLSNPHDGPFVALQRHTIAQTPSLVKAIGSEVRRTLKISLALIWKVQRAPNGPIIFPPPFYRCYTPTSSHLIHSTAASLRLTSYILEFERKAVFTIERRDAIWRRDEAKISDDTKYRWTRGRIPMESVDKFYNDVGCYWAVGHLTILICITDASFSKTPQPNARVWATFDLSSGLLLVDRGLADDLSLPLPCNSRISRVLVPLLQAWRKPISTPCCVGTPATKTWRVVGWDSGEGRFYATRLCKLRLRRKNSLRLRHPIHMSITPVGTGKTCCTYERSQSEGVRARPLVAWVARYSAARCFHKAKPRCCLWLDRAAITVSRSKRTRNDASGDASGEIIMAMLSAGMKGRGKQEVPEKTRQPEASSGTIPTCENAGVTQPEIEPGSPWWKASRLTAQSPGPLPIVQTASSTLPCLDARSHRFPSHWSLPALLIVLRARHLSSLNCPDSRLSSSLGSEARWTHSISSQYLEYSPHPESRREARTKKLEPALDLGRSGERNSVPRDRERWREKCVAIYEGKPLRVLGVIFERMFRSSPSSLSARLGGAVNLRRVCEDRESTIKWSVEWAETVTSGSEVCGLRAWLQDILGVVSRGEKKWTGVAGLKDERQPDIKVWYKLFRDSRLPQSGLVLPNPGKRESPLPGHVALCDADTRAMQSGGRRLSPCDAGRDGVFMRAVELRPLHVVRVAHRRLEYRARWRSVKPLRSYSGGPEFDLRSSQPYFGFPWSQHMPSVAENRDYSHNVTGNIHPTSLDAPQSVVSLQWMFGAGRVLWSVAKEGTWGKKDKKDVKREGWRKGDWTAAIDRMEAVQHSQASRFQGSQIKTRLSPAAS